MCVYMRACIFIVCVDAFVWMYLCVRSCMHMYVYDCVCMCLHAYMYICVSVCMRVYVVCVCVHMPVYMCVCICIYACMHVGMHACIRICRYIYILWHDRSLLKCEICRPTGALAWGDDSRTSHFKKLPRQVSPSHSLHQLLHERVQATLLQTSNTMGDKLPHWHLGFPLLTILHGPLHLTEKKKYALCWCRTFWHRLRDRFFLRMSCSFWFVPCSWGLPSQDLWRSYYNTCIT